MQIVGAGPVHKRFPLASSRASNRTKQRFTSARFAMNQTPRTTERSTSYNGVRLCTTLPVAEPSAAPLRQNCGVAPRRSWQRHFPRCGQREGVSNRHVSHWTTRLKSRRIKSLRSSLTRVRPVRRPGPGPSGRVGQPGANRRATAVWKSHPFKGVPDPHPTNPPGEPNSKSPTQLGPTFHIGTLPEL